MSSGGCGTTSSAFSIGGATGGTDYYAAVEK